MEYRNLGNSGLKISELSFGSWVTFVNQLGQKQALECMDYAYEQGINFFDNAEAYASGDSEILMGKVLNKLKWTRDTYIVSSKVFGEVNYLLKEVYPKNIFMMHAMQH